MINLDNVRITKKELDKPSMSMIYLDYNSDKEIEVKTMTKLLNVTKKMKDEDIESLIIDKIKSLGDIGNLTDAKTLIIDEEMVQ